MRLIDADELKKDDEVTQWLSLDAVRTGKMLKMFSELFVKKIYDAPTVQAVPIPDNATNGDVLKAFFSNINRDYDVKHKMGQILFTHEWWNMPYKGSDGEWDRVTMIDVNGNTHKVTFQKEIEDIGDYPDEIPNQFDNLTGSMNI